MLFGDWGTSRLYVLGLAFAFTGHASFWFIVAMCVLMIGVGVSYVTVCRLFPDGGGVYSAAKQRSQLLAVVGGLLLCADYVVTASLSCLDGFHYIGIQGFSLLDVAHRAGLAPESFAHARVISGLASTQADAVLAALMILAIGVLNYLGPRKTGTIALYIALVTIGLTFIIGLACLPHLGGARLDSPLDAAAFHSPRKFAEEAWRSWIGLTEIVLALSGVEAVANMTGIMIQPVGRTAKRTILPVLIEIVILNLVLAAAMNTLGDNILYATGPDGVRIPAHTSDMLKVIATRYVHPTFAIVSSWVFAALLLSAVNTAVGALVSVQFMLSRDGELPHKFSGLNRFGMPLVPLYVAAIAPAVVLLIFPKVEALADLYAVGVVGAIAINLGSVSTNRAMGMKRRERLLMIVLASILVLIEVTICIVKPHAREFALMVLVVGLAGRLATIVGNRAIPVPGGRRIGYLIVSGASVAVVLAITLFMGNSVLGFVLTVAVAGVVGFASSQAQVYREAVRAAHVPYVPPLFGHGEISIGMVEGVPVRKRMLLPGAYTPKSRIMVPTQGNPSLLDFAFEECKIRQAELQILFIRVLAVTPMGPTTIPTLAEDAEALALFDRLRDRAEAEGIPLRLLYGVARDVPDAILDMAVTHGADLLLLGATRRGVLWKAMKGDVIQGVAENLPEEVGLLIHA
jgi:amino acid transporter/nucleotide-binding universal stress UspA family protein